MKKVKAAAREELQWAQMERTVEDVRQEKEQLASRVHRQEKELEELRAMAREAEAVSVCLIFKISSVMAYLDTSRYKCLSSGYHV